MWSVYKRMAELWDKQSGGGLSKEEWVEMKMCLEANKNLARKLSELENLSRVASSTGDTDWLHDICGSIEGIQNKITGTSLV